MSQNIEILAKRTSGIIVGAVMLWIVAILLALLFVFAVVFDGLNDAAFLTVIAAIFSLACAGGAIYFTVLTKNTPLVLAGFSSGVITFYLSKTEVTTVKPEEIKFISQKNYSTRYGTASSGKLTIELNNSKTIELHHVRDVDAVRRRLEKLKEQSAGGSI